SKFLQWFAVVKWEQQSVGALFGVFSAPLIFIPFLPRRLQRGAQIANERPVSVVRAPTRLLNQELDSRFLFSESRWGEFGTVGRGHHLVPPSSQPTIGCWDANCYGCLIYTKQNGARIHERRSGV